MLMIKQIHSYLLLGYDLTHIKQYKHKIKWSAA